MDKISLVIPCFHNQANIQQLAQALLSNEQLFSSETAFEYILVDDGSGDKTWEKICAFENEFPNKVTGIKLARNVGSYNAIYAGIQKVTGNCVVVMAADLQDPPSHIKALFEEWKEGHKLIIANRLNPRKIASLYFKTLKWLGLKNLPDGGFDFCLFSKGLSQNLLAFQPRGAISLYRLLQLSETPVFVPYKKEERQIGKSSWTTWKRVLLALCTFERYSFIKLIHLSVFCFLFSALTMMLATQFSWLVGFGILSLVVGLVLEIIRTVLRRKQQDLTIIIEQVI